MNDISSCPLGASINFFSVIQGKLDVSDTERITVELAHTVALESVGAIALALVILSCLLDGILDVTTINCSGRGVTILVQYESDDNSKAYNHEQDGKESDIARFEASINATISEIIPQNQRGMGGLVYLRPSIRKIFVLDLLLFVVASHDTAFAAANRHCIEELFLSIHALELNIGVYTARLLLIHVLFLVL